jgi:Subtilase family/Secretion system C-terminal sorting domain
MKKWFLLLSFLVIGYFSWIAEPINLEETQIGYSEKTKIILEGVEGNIESTDFSLNGIALLKEKYPDLDGNGINIAQKEHRPDPDDIDIKSNIFPSFLESDKTTLHATQVATIMVSKGLSSPLNEGVAPKSKLYSVSFNSLNPESDDFYLNNKISIINNSFGTEIEPYYGQNAVEYDAICQRNPHLFYVFSSGNIGSQKSLTGKYANIFGVANMTGNYKMSKNVLTVGSVNQYGELTPESSKGPAYDGRIKPELVAFSVNGTSEAAALVSGTVALFQQSFQKKFGKLPSSSLTKAVLINTANDLGAKGPDFFTGFGSINIFKAVEDIQQQHFLEKNLVDKEQKAIIINVPDKVSLLKVTLNWTDPPSNKNAPTALVNNLDLSLSTNNPNLTTWQPWVLSSYPQIDSLGKIATRKKDFLNNVEQITLENPQAGAYKIIVQGEKITTSGQNYSLAYHWEFSEQFQWIFPNQNTKIVANSITPIRWQNTFSDTLGQLSYSLDEGKTWQLIGNNIDLKTGLYEWKTPSVLGKIMLKFTFGSYVFMSKMFIVSPILELNANFFCADSTQLRWSLPFANSPKVKYNIFQLDKKNNTWTKVNSTANSEITLKGNLSNDFFSVEPFIDTEIIGFKSNLISSKLSNVNCFFNYFETSLEKNTALITFNLTSLKGIKSLTFQKVNLSNVSDIKSIPVSQNTFSYQANDEKLLDGVNIYQVKINFINGKSIYSNLSQLFYSESDKFWLYPNPIKSGDILKVQSNSQETFQFRLYNMNGQFICEYPIFNGYNSLPLPTFSSGTYLYIISSTESSFIKKGKITISP